MVGEPGGPGGEVALFGQAQRPAGGRLVGLASGPMVTGQLQQVAADGVQAVAAAQHGLAVQGCQQVQAGPGALHHGHGDGAVEGHHRAWGDAFQ